MLDTNLLSQIELLPKSTRLYILAILLVYPEYQKIDDPLDLLILLHSLLGYKLNPRDEIPYQYSDITCLRCGSDSGYYPNYIGYIAHCPSCVSPEQLPTFRYEHINRLLWWRSDILPNDMEVIVQHIDVLLSKIKIDKSSKLK